MKTSMFQELVNTVSKLNVSEISAERKEKLQPLVDFVQFKVNKKEQIRLNFICTHNSRRSHLSQIWAQALAFHFGIKKVFCYSGGTEATAVFPEALVALQNVGFKINKLSEDVNSVYAVKYAADEHPVVAFSKKFDAEFNPSSGFVAILTCVEADGTCPFIAGAEQRIALPFKDPKAFDNKPQKAEKYHERSLQIATELFHVFSQIKP